MFKTLGGGGLNKISVFRAHIGFKLQFVCCKVGRQQWYENLKPFIDFTYDQMLIFPINTEL